MATTVDRFQLHPVKNIENGNYEATAHFPFPAIPDKAQEQRYVETYWLSFATLYRELLNTCPPEIQKFSTSKSGEDKWENLDDYARQMLRELYQFRMKHELQQDGKRHGYSCYAWVYIAVLPKSHVITFVTRGELVYKPLEMGKRSVQDAYGTKIDIHYG